MLKATAVVLAGGKSTRMGVDKAFVKFYKDRMLLENAVNLMKKVFSEVIVSANGTIPGLDVLAIVDKYPGHGPLGGIHAALSSSAYYYNFVVACDMPFINTKLAAYMYEIAYGYDVVVPKIEEFYQPLFAVYSKNCLDAIEAQLKDMRNKIIDFYDKVSVRYVELAELNKFGDHQSIFFNVNTPHDLEKARMIAGRENNGQQV